MSVLTSDTRDAIVQPKSLVRRSRLSLYAELTKIRLSALVVVTTAVGFVLASTSEINWTVLGWTVLGTALCAAATAALNQLIERTADARMTRTENRPLPSGDLSNAECLSVGIIMACIGLTILILYTNLMATGLTFMTIVAYVAIYTPLKRITSMNTLVGAICGALPPMIGWAAVDPSLHIGAWVLAGVLFIWQLPHFLALAWLYRDDYTRGGFIMLPAVDEHGRLTSRITILGSLLLIPMTLSATLFGVTTLPFAIAALLLGMLMVIASMHMASRRTLASAKRLFLVSILYLPLILGAMVAFRQPREIVFYLTPSAARTVIGSAGASDHIDASSRTESQVTMRDQ